MRGQRAFPGKHCSVEEGDQEGVVTKVGEGQEGAWGTASQVPGAARSNREVRSENCPIDWP